MSIIYLDVEKTGEIDDFIAMCKSDSHINGVKLRKAHYKLGQQLAERIFCDLYHPTSKNTPSITLIVMMRAGLCFGMGIANKLEQLGLEVSILFYFNDEQWNKEKTNYPQFFDNDILLVDAVINTGDGIIKFAQTISNNKNIFFATNVLSKNAVKKFDDKRLYTIRVSEKTFKGSKTDGVKDGKGPDTGDRLFNTK
jgi:uracil phosphoribosyltransferase